MAVNSPEPMLLNDEQMRQYIANGFVILRPNLADELHRTIDDKFNFIRENEFNPGNNIIPRLPELEQILKTPEVRGALISVLGENYITHSHRFWHMRSPDADTYSSQEKLTEKVANGCHQDAYGPASQARSHRTRYARIMYYSQDTPIEMGPTHVLAGTHCHDALSEEDCQRVLPVEGAAGLVFLSHFDIGHSAGVNLCDRFRHMIKFIFMRAEEPKQPSWDCQDTAWQPPQDLAAPYNLEPAWQNLWNWHCGKRSVAPATAAEAPEIESFIKTLTEEISLEEKLEVLTQLARAGVAAAAAVPLLVDMLNSTHQALRTAAIYTLAAIGAPAIEALCQSLERAGEGVSNGEDSPEFDKRWITLHDAAYALSAIGAAAVDPLAKLLQSAHEWTRMNAAFALGEMDSEAAAAVPALEAALQDESHYVVRLAINSLGTIGKGVPIESLSQLLGAVRPGWEEEKNWTWTVRNAVNVTAAMALTRLGRQAAIAEEDLIKALEDPFGQVGFFAVQALNRIGTDSARQAVIDHLIAHRWDPAITKGRPY
jgi:HEAT repeat protein